MLRKLLYERIKVIVGLLKLDEGGIVLNLKFVEFLLEFVLKFFLEIDALGEFNKEIFGVIFVRIVISTRIRLLSFYLLLSSLDSFF